MNVACDFGLKVRFQKTKMMVAGCEVTSTDAELFYVNIGTECEGVYLVVMASGGVDANVGSKWWYQCFFMEQSVGHHCVNTCTR